MNKFVIFALPRSRTYWLSHFLSYVKGGQRVRHVGHDAFSRCSTVEECLGLFEGEGGLDGTVETGAAFAFPLIKREMVGAKFLVIQRNPEESLKSLIRAGIMPDAQDWVRRAHDLWQVSGAGVRTIDFEDLDNESALRWMWSWLLECPWDQSWWEYWAPRRIEVDLEKRKKELAARAGAVEGLKAEVEERKNGTA